MWPNTTAKGLKPRDSCTAAKSKSVYLHLNLFLYQNSMTLLYFSRSGETFQGHLDFQDDMLMTYIV